MIRKSILSVLMGVVFAGLLSLAISAKAGCAGFCMNQVGDYYYAGCTISCSLDTCHVTCFYTKGPASLEDPSVTD